MTHYRVSIRFAGSRAWYVSDEHAETAREAVVACIEQRSAEWRTGLAYEVVVRDVDAERGQP